MSEQLREALSAVVDGEASEFETRRVLDELARDDTLAASWESYHLVGAALRGENVAAVAQLRARMWQALDADPAADGDIDLPHPPQSVDTAAASSHRSRWLGGLAAAALLVVVVTAGGLLNQDQLPDGGTIAQSSVPRVSVSETPASAAEPVVAEQTLLPVAATTAADTADAIDYGPGFIPNPGLQEDHWRRNEGFFLHHVQQRGLNDANLLPMIKLISYE